MHPFPANFSFFPFTREKIEASLNAGINRFSLGVQTFDTRIRKSLGRRKTSLNNLYSRGRSECVPLGSGAGGISRIPFDLYF